MDQQQKPVIRIVNIPSINPAAGMENERTVIEINRGQLVVEVKGMGSTEGKFRITGRDAGKLHASMAGGDMPAPDDEGWLAIVDYGIALVYVEPVTFGHVILDMFLNT